MRMDNESQSFLKYVSMTELMFGMNMIGRQKGWVGAARSRDERPYGLKGRMMMDGCCTIERVWHIQYDMGYGMRTHEVW